jgi:hypothetical protein
MKLYELAEMSLDDVVESHATYLDTYQDTAPIMLMGQIAGETVIETGVCGCLLGTAAYTCGTRPDDDDEIYGTLRKNVPWHSELISCPDCQTREITLLSCADHLHYHHNWSRKEIIEHLRPIEDAFEQQYAKREREAECPDLHTEPATTALLTK